MYTKIMKYKKKNMVDSLTDKNLEELQQVFSLFRIGKKDSYMNMNEIKKMLDLLGIAPSKAELEEFVDMFDSTGDKRLDFPEFLSMILRQYERTDEEQDDDMADAYEMFKDDAEDFITA